MQVNIGPPLPAVIFEQPPAIVAIPQSDIFYAPSVREYDTYRAGDWWYLNREGYWYRSRSHRGPFEGIPYDRVPERLFALPGEYHRYPSRRAAEARAYDRGYDDRSEGKPSSPYRPGSNRDRAYREGEYDASHEGTGEKHEGKHYGKHQGKHTQHDDR